MRKGHFKFNCLEREILDNVTTSINYGIANSDRPTQSGSVGAKVSR